MVLILGGIDVKRLSVLRDIIEDSRSRIYNTVEVKNDVLIRNNITVDAVRRTYFDTMGRQLYNALDNGSPNLIYDETQGIRDAIYIYTDFAPKHFLRNETYDQIFNNLEKLKWLKLSARTE